MESERRCGTPRSGNERDSSRSRFCTNFTAAELHHMLIQLKKDLVPAECQGSDWSFSTLVKALANVASFDRVPCVRLSVRARVDVCGACLTAVNV